MRVKFRSGLPAIRHKTLLGFGRCGRKCLRFQNENLLYWCRLRWWANHGDDGAEGADD